MSAPEMVLQYIESLKWPVMTALILFWLRAPLTGLVGRLNSGRLEAPGFALEVSSELAGQAAETALAIEAGDRRTPGDGIEPADEEPADEDPAETDTAETTPPAAASIDAVTAAANLSAKDRKTVDDGIVELFIVARRAKSMQMFNGKPAQAVRDTRLALADAVWKVAFPVAGKVRRPSRLELWPGTPQEFRQGLDELLDLFDMVSGNPELVTEYTALKVHEAVRSWASQYAVYLTSVLAEADRSHE
ncbi:hypothetical protein ACWIGI_25195 [Nocardia sp. NPDC055321]